MKIEIYFRFLPFKKRSEHYEDSNLPARVCMIGLKTDLICKIFDFLVLNRYYRNYRTNLNIIEQWFRTSVRDYYC